MTPEEKLDKTIAGLTDLLRMVPFTIEFRVKKKPAGIKIIYEVTQELMNQMMEKAARKEEQP